jgi:four helix bundle protein
LGVADFKKLRVWQKAHALSLSVDRASRQIRDRRYASLRNQIFRAAMSISANIAEGRGQKSEKDFARFLGYALNSTSEVEHHLIVARDTNAFPESDFVSLLAQTIDVRKMLYGLLKALSNEAASDASGENDPGSSTRHAAVKRTARTG